MSAGRLPRAFFARDTRTVARALLGCTLVHRRPGEGTLRARIVETEAYHGPTDRASHARFGPTKRAAIMFGPPAVAYVYLIYGMHHCLNVVTGPEGFPSAVLLRAVDRLRHRGPGQAPRPGALGTRVEGPGRLTRALAIDRETHNGATVLGSSAAVFLEGPARRDPTERIVAGPRVGIAYAGTWAQKSWRYRLLAG